MVEVKTVFIYFTRFLKVVIVLALVAYGAACGLIAKNSVESKTLDNQGKAFAVLAQAGYMSFCILLILAEFGFAWFEKGLYVFHFWVGRGLFLGWLGIQAINQGEQIVTVVAGEQATINPGDIQTMTQAIGYTMISSGLLYIVMSTFCLQKLVGVGSMEEVDSGFSNMGPASGSGKDTSSNSLSVPLNDTASGGKVASSLDEDDLKLLQNAASALGMTVRELRNKFSGANGSREADRYFQDKEARLAAALDQAKAAKQQAAAAIPRGKSMKNDDGAPLAKQSSGAVAAPLERQQSYAAPADTRSVFIDDDDDTARRKRNDDDDLEAQYYSNRHSE